MKIFISIVLFSIYSLVAQAATAENPENTSMKEVTEVATQSLAVFRELVTADNAKSLGFESVKEASEAKTETPIPVFMVQLDDLRAYKKGDDVSKLLKDIHQQIVPLSVNGQVRSSVTVEKSKENWRSQGFGSPNLAKSLDQARKVGAQAAGLPANSFFAVHVAALRTYFIAHRSGDKLMFTTVREDSQLKLPAGKTIPAEEALTALVPIAQQYNELPL